MARTLPISILFAVAAAASLQASPIFNYTLGSGIVVNDQVYNGFVAAGNVWASRFADPITINVRISYSSLGPGILGSTSNSFYTGTYSTIRSALVADSTTAADAVATANLPSAPSLSFAQNHTSECSNCSTPYLDNNGSFNNTHVDLTGAQAKALSLVPANDPALDGSITFSSDFAFDFDPADGITAGYYDFIGVATHEIGHLMGFFSTVDDWDFCGRSDFPCFSGTRALSENETDPGVLDLFRVSTDSGFGTIMDQSADNRPKYFSLDGGATLGPQFARGRNYGDGRQASHWRDSFGLGIMDPTASPGELLAVTANDLTALDVIGWDAVTVPEPSTMELLGSVLAAAALFKRKT